MSRWSGRLITQNPVTPSGPTPTSSAPGIWTLPEVAYWNRQGRWPSAGADPYWSYVSYLLGTTSTNAAQNNTFLDSSTNNLTITRAGNTTQGALTPYDPLWSNYFDGSGDYLTSSGSAASTVGSGDFSVEAFVFWTSYPTQYTSIFSTRSTNNSNAAAFTVGVESSGYVYAYSNAFIAQTSSGVFALNTWNHVVFTRSGTTARLFVNGVLRATGTNSQNFSDQGFAVGANRDGTEPGAGYVSNVRLVKGSIPTDYQTSSTTVGTTIFTPPAVSLTAISGTGILTCQSNRFIDNSGNSLTITANGNTTVAAFNPFVLAPPGYSTVDNGGSVYFDGGADYLTVPSDAAFGYGTGDFTIEFWMYLTGTPDQTIISNLTSASSTNPHIYYSAGSVRYYTVSADRITSGAGSIVVGQWYHVALTRASGSTRMFVNGVQAGSTYADSNNYGTTAPLGIATYWSGGSPVTTNTFTGYMSNVRIVKGTAVYTSTFTPPASPVTAISGTSILCNFTNAGIFDASMNNVMETVGNAQVSTGQAKYGTTSAYIPNATSLLKGPLTQNTAFGTGDFTVEAWIYSVATTSLYTCIFTSRDGVASNANAVFFGLKPTTNQLTFFTSSEIIGTSTAVSTGAWTHVALVRNAGATAIYINGTSAGTATFTTALTGTGLAIGNEYSLASGNGGLYVDDLRITKGYARYTANFTPPTAALPVY